MKKVILIILLFYSPLLWRGAGSKVCAQQRQLDSLKKLLTEYNEVNEKQLQLLNAIVPIQVNIKPNDALTNADKAIALAQKLNNQKGLAVAFNNKGFVLLRKSRYDDATIFLKKALAINTSLKNKNGTADNQTNLAEILRRQGETDSAKTVFDKALIIYQETKNKNGIADVYYYLGLVYRDLSDNKNMLKSIEKAIELYKQSGNESGLSLAINSKSGYYSRTSDFPKSIELLKGSIAINERIGNLYGLALDYGNIGLDYADFNQFPQAINYSLKGLRINEQMENHHMVANTYINIGTFYFDLKQLNKGLEFTQKGTALFEQLKINNGQYRMGCTYIGIIFSALNSNDSALKYLNISLAKNLAANDDWALSTCYNGLGNAYLATSKYDSAIICFNKALEVDKKIENPIGIEVDYFGLGKSISLAADVVLIKSGINPYEKDKLIEDYFQKTILISKETEDKKISRDVYKEISKFYEGKGDVKKSFDYYQQYIAYKDSILNTDNTNSIALLQIQYDTEKKEQQIALLTKDLQLQQAELQKQNTTRNAFIAGFALVALLAGITYNRYRIKKKANKQIENTLTHLKNTQEQLIEREKLASLGKLTVDVAKQIEVPVMHINQINIKNRTLLNNIKFNKTFSGSTTVDELKNNLQQIYNYGKDADGIVKKVLIETRKLQG